MNRRPLKRRAKSSTWRDGESEKSPGKAPIEEEKRADDRKEKKSERERGNRRHSIWDTREEMERGREGRDGGKGHWTVSFRDGY